MNPNKKTYALIILDGWGYREDGTFNAIAAARTPHWDYLWKHYSHGMIDASGLAVGLPPGQMGNSEVGHIHIGAGRRIYQDLTRIDRSIESGEFFENPVLTQAFATAEQTGRAIHLMGLFSPGGVHSHENHLYEILKLAEQKKFNRLFIHLFLDGRDTPPKSVEKSIEYLQKTFKVRVASIIGRYYAMDRDKRWDRIQKAYDLLTEGKADYIAKTVEEAISEAYKRGETDEFVKPTRILNDKNDSPIIEDGDSVIFFNFRSDRARELSRAFLLEDFSGFKRDRRPKLAHFITFTQYAADISSEILFPPLPIKNMLGDYLSQKGLSQLRLAETEKYAHVTFFFNGGMEEPFLNESRILVSSPKVTTYDLVPEMSAYEVTDHLVRAILEHSYDFIVCNFANPDMVGHTGNFEATVKAVEVIDECLGKIFSALKETGSEAVITADHGNAEYMFNFDTGQAHTAHTSELVPFIYVGRPAKALTSVGTLIDIAPTILYLMGLEKPSEMEGNPLVTLL